MQPSAEYWNSLHGRMARVTPVAFVVGGVKIRNLALGPASLTDPLLHNHLMETSFPAAPPGSVRVLREETAFTSDALGITTMRDWSRTRVPLVADFEADLVSATAYGECVLQVPELVGSDLNNLIFEATQKRDPPDKQTFIARVSKFKSAGQIADLGQVSIVGTQIDTTDTAARLTRTANGAFISCEPPAPVSGPDFGRSTLGAGVFTEHLDEIRAAGQPAPGCASDVAMIGNGRNTYYSFWLLIVGGALSGLVAVLGAGLSYLWRARPAARRNMAAAALNDQSRFRPASNMDHGSSASITSVRNYGPALALALALFLWRVRLRRRYRQTGSS